VQLKFETFELPAIQPQHLWKESQRPIRGGEVPPETPLFAFLLVNKVTPTSVSDMRAGEQVTRDDRFGVFGDGIVGPLT
jgi:hypothetical protein